MEQLQISYGFDATPYLADIKPGEEEGESKLDNNENTTQSQTAMESNEEVSAGHQAQTLADAAEFGSMSRYGSLSRTRHVKGGAMAAQAAIEAFRNRASVDGTPIGNAVEILSHCGVLFGAKEDVPEIQANALKVLWSDSGIQYCFLRANEYHLIDSCKYLMESSSRICAKGYIPEDDDILTARVITTSVTEQPFSMDGYSVRIIDLGGQRSERKKWAPYFDDAVAIIFVAALSAYDQAMYEDGVTNRRSGDSGKTTVMKQFRLLYGSGFTHEDRDMFRTVILENLLCNAKCLIEAMEVLQIPFGFNPAEMMVDSNAANSVEGSGETLSNEFDTIGSIQEIEYLETRCAGHKRTKSIRGGIKAATIAAEVYDSGKNPGGDQRLRKAVKLIMTTPAFPNGDHLHIPYGFAEAVKILWADPGIQYCYFRSNEYQLLDNCE
ncbi:hypothetical protein HDU76_009452 [Blyttiomyces sp. JEL0837]|nr:hypothetical protein HDU76_009452 [Blyttiomyces sp. JEL0837]